jgi:hypothetical protein
MKKCEVLIGGVLIDPMTAPSGKCSPLRNCGLPSIGQFTVVGPESYAATGKVARTNMHLCSMHYQKQKSYGRRVERTEKK